MSATRTDAIGQEIKIGDVVKPFAKSAHSMALSVVTKFNPVMIQINGAENIDSDRIVVVTQNLIAIGKQATVDKLQQQYQSVLDTKEVVAKIPVRYLVIGTPRATIPTAWLIRFNYVNIDSARKALETVRKKFLEHTGEKATHMLCKNNKKELYWGSVDHWYIDKGVHAWRTLPNTIAAIANGPDELIEITPGDPVTELKFK